MESALIVSGAPKGSATLRELLSTHAFRDIQDTASAGEARRMLLDRAVDLCVINAPLTDEFGVELALDLAEKGFCQVLMVVKNDLCDQVSAKVEEAGVFVLGKPISPPFLWSALKLLEATHRRMQGLQNQNELLKRKIEDIRLVDRAKCLLISYLKMTEPQAHKYIEKQAMDLRMTKREVAVDILKIYEG